MLRRKQVEKLPEASEQNEEIALDFAGCFQNAKKRRKFILVSIDHYSGWPEAKFLHRRQQKSGRIFKTLYCTIRGTAKNQN